MIDLYESYNRFTHYRFNVLMKDFCKQADEKIKKLKFSDSHREFTFYFHKGDYLKCLSPKYRDVLKKESWRGISVIFLKAFMQFIRKYFHREKKLSM